MYYREISKIKQKNHTHTQAHSIIMHKFFKPLADKDEAVQQTQRLLAQSAGEVHQESAARQRALLLKPGRGRPKKQTNAHVVMAAAAAAQPQTHCQEDVDVPVTKRGKYTNWSVMLSHDLEMNYN